MLVACLIGLVVVSGLIVWVCCLLLCFLFWVWLFRLRCFVGLIGFAVAVLAVDTLR